MHTTLSFYQPIRSTYFLLRDAEERVDEGREKLLFHIETGDYFSMTATVLGFVEEKLMQLERANPLQESDSPELQLLRSTRDDLRYLNTHYTVCPKTRSYSLSAEKR